jgi:DMSO/TMAO reductase YedYZ molybdopterin-dependent catalytic subunit
MSAGTRRNFLRSVIAALPLLSSLRRGGLASMVSMTVAGNEKIIVAPGTSRDALVDKNPANLDTHRLEPTPLKEFGAMGLEDHEVDLSTWRLTVGGQLAQPFELSYQELRSLPSIEKKVLLVCPSVFANHGVWKGISVVTLLEKGRTQPKVNYVTFTGPRGKYQKTLRVPLDQVRSDTVFLAYAVNGTVLPMKHGFPLRLVAEGYFGYDWIKYVDSIEAEGIEG